jgi:transcriptional regulator with XRE-family HTH domain
MKRVKQPEGASNPITIMRKIAQLTQEQLANITDTSRQYILRAEQAVYAEAPVGLLMALVAQLADMDLDYGYDLDEMHAQYSDYQRAVRQEHYGILVPFKADKFMALELSGHPFKYWRGASGVDSRIAVSKYYCVHPALMFRFEEQTHLVNSVPGELRSGLLESGYSKELLDVLEEKYQNYRTIRNERVEIS